MKIIGTGLSGMVGSRVVELLGKKHEFVDFSLDSGVDITDSLALVNAFGQHPNASVVLHLAAFTDVNVAHEQQGDKQGICYRVNVVGTEQLARHCAETGKYLIHISTDFVFDGRNPPAGGYTEENEPHPIEWYGQTKLWAEGKVKASGTGAVIFRLAFPYKARPAPEHLEPKVKLDLVRKIKQQLEKGETLKMFTDQTITPTFIDDIAKAIEHAIAHRPKGVYHLVGSESLSPFSLAQKIARTFRLNAKLIQPNSLVEFMKTPSRPRQQNMTLSNKKLQGDFGIRMKTVEEGLTEIKQQLS